jgi:hypothetical protein
MWQKAGFLINMRFCTYEIFWAELENSGQNEGTEVGSKKTLDRGREH